MCIVPYSLALLIRPYSKLTQTTGFVPPLGCANNADVADIQGQSEAFYGTPPQACKGFGLLQDPFSGMWTVLPAGSCRKFVETDEPPGAIAQRDRPSPIVANFFLLLDVDSNEQNPHTVCE